ncbi:hypothetical protein NK6_4064 [Bradyrhizobium diazoefficiens]|jgi:hypothetical protein|uniref:Uncharacterized protein n=1 Tax=Bradyrhizobium diazoefficiens TaxID=1355477 RepID=A0A0E4FTX4_9BRAD|nr:hypothetical protein NK6_4064 [Bradyrhizobium diazoefficiens]
MDSGLDAAHRPGMTTTKSPPSPKTAGLFHARIKLMESARAM